MKHTSSVCSPVISIILPVYNGSKTIQDAIDSVLAQSFTNFELIVCDDASTDGTLEILETITDDRLFILHNNKNIGEGLSRNRAIDQATGEWLAFIDADDMWIPERLEVLLKFADISAKEILFDDIMECHDTPHGMTPWRAMRGSHAFGAYGSESVKVSIDRLLTSDRMLIKPLIPLKYINQHNIRHSQRKFGADIEFFIELFALGLSLRYIPRPMYFYRIAPGSMTSLHNRMTLFKEIFENAVTKFDHSITIQLALNKKIKEVHRSELYMPFVYALKKRQILNVVRLIYKHPWIFYEFFHRFFHSFRYHLHRLRYGGRTRGIS